MKSVKLAFHCAVAASGIHGLATQVAKAADAQAPALPTGIESTETLRNQSRDRFAFDPILGINPNRGSFSTEIPIALPPNLTGLQGIKLQYQSQSGQNQGMGHGWSWDLPFVLKNPKGNSRVPYIIQGLLGVSELVPTKEDLGILEEESLKILQTARLQPGLDIRLEAYRPLAESNYTLYVRAVSAGTPHSFDPNPIVNSCYGP